MLPRLHEPTMPMFTIFQIVEIGTARSAQCDLGLTRWVMSMVSCQKGPTCHAYAWQIGPFWQDTLDVSNSPRGDTAYMKVAVGLLSQGTVRLGRRWCASSDKQMSTLIARFIGPTWGPSGADRTQVGPMLAPRTLLSGKVRVHHQR